MTKILATIFKWNFLNSGLTHNVSKCRNTFVLVPVRTLYSQKTLGVDNYIQTRDKIKQQFATLNEKFRIKMNEYVTEDSKKTNMIFTEDLKNMIHLAEGNEADVTLAVKMMKKFNQQHKDLRFGSFVFGPVVMRMFHFLNKPNVALECFKSPELDGFFDQLMSYQLLLDLLYENQQYDEVLSTFEFIKSKQIQGTKYPKNIIVLTMAACYKQNTTASLEFALKLWKELQEVGHLPMRRAVTFCAGLALLQGKPEVTIELVATTKKQNYVTIRNLKVAALAELGRVDEMLLVLKSVLDIDDPNPNLKHTFCKDVIDKAREAVQKQDNATVKSDFERIEKQLTALELIVTENLDNQLCSEIVSPPFINFKQQSQHRKSIPRFDYDASKPRHNSKYKIVQQRPGLKDMY